MTTENKLHADFEALLTALKAVSPDDEAAFRSLERKYKELLDDCWYGDISYADAKEELFQECYDCLPVDA